MSDWVADLRLKLEAKGCDESVIESCISAAVNARGMKPKAVQAKKETKQTLKVSIHLLEVTNKCPSCQASAKRVHTGVWTRRESGAGETFKVDDDLEAPEGARIVKRTEQYQLCDHCLRKERVLTAVERMAKSNASFLQDLEELVETHGE